MRIATLVPCRATTQIVIVIEVAAEIRLTIEVIAFDSSSLYLSKLCSVAANAVILSTAIASAIVIVACWFVDAAIIDAIVNVENLCENMRRYRSF